MISKISQLVIMSAVAYRSLGSKLTAPDHDHTIHQRNKSQQSKAKLTPEGEGEKNVSKLAVDSARLR